MTGTTLPFEKEFLRKDGNRVPVLVGVAAFENRTDRCVASVVDPTERKRTEDALRRASDRLARATQAEIVAQAFDPFITTKPSGMGMGWAICRSHGGHLWIVNNGARGATVAITLMAGDRP